MPSASGPTTGPRPCAQPLASTPVWEAQGGCTPETRACLHRLCGVVAVVEGLDLGAVKARLADQVAVLLARAGGRAIRRRQTIVGGQPGLPHDVGAVLVLEP